MTIRQQGGVFGRNPTFNDVGVNDLTANGVTTSSLDVNGTGLIDTLGVGTTSPQKPFVVSDAGNIGLEISPNDAAQGYTRVLNYNRTAGQYEPLRFEGASHRFYTGTAGSTLAGEFTSAGNLAFQSGQGIDFSATSGTGTSELFDDYEEGLFDVTMSASTSGTITLDYTRLAYTKIGRMVCVTGEIRVGSVLLPVGDITINSLPFANSGLSGRASNVSFLVGAYGLTGSPTGVIQGHINGGGTAINLRLVNNFSASSLSSYLQAGSAFIFCFAYTAA